MKKQVMSEIISFLLILLFLYAGVSKIYGFPGFIRDMHNQPFPLWFSNFLILFIPLMELLLVAMLFVHRTRRWGLWGSLVVMTAFTLYTSVILLRLFGRIPCSCGGIIKSLSWRQHLLFNLFFVGVAIIDLYLHIDNKKKSVNTTTYRTN